MGLIPFVAICFTVGLWDRIYPVVAGLPFNIFWLILWTLLTPLCLWGAYRSDQRNATQDSLAGRLGLLPAGASNKEFAITAIVTENYHRSGRRAHAGARLWERPGTGHGARSAGE